MPKISIIIPVYNTEKYILECLDSILNQTFRDIEIICIDDCSSDTSFNILKEYEKRDCRIIVGQNAKNLGPGLTRNKGLKLARGEYVIFFDSDDWMREDACEILYSKLKDNDLDILICNYNLYDNIGKRYSPSFNFPKDKNIYNKVIDYNASQELFLNWCVNSKVFKREFLLHNNLLFNELRNFEDPMHYLETLIRASRIMVIDDILSTYRVYRRNSLTFEYVKHPHKMAESLLNFYKWVERNEELNKISLLKNYLLREYVSNNIIYYRQKNMFWNKKLYDETKECLSNINLDIFKENYNDGNKLIQTFLKDSYFYFNIKSLFKNLFPTFFKLLLSVKYSNKSVQNSVIAEVSGGDKANLDVPKISVIIPVYNVAAYLEECLDSLLSQPFEDIEIICIDDASTDNSYSILCGYAKNDSRIKVLHNPKNIGLGASRNLGIEFAKGKYIHFVDSDDYVNKNIYTLTFELAEKYSLDIVNFSYYLFPAKGNAILQKYDDEIVGKVVNYKEINLIPVSPAVWRRLYRRDFLFKNNIRFSSIKLFEDVSFFIKCFVVASRMYFINTPLYVYRIRHNSLYSERYKFYEYYFKMFDDVEEFAVTLDDYESKSIVYNYVFNHIIYAYIDLIERDFILALRYYPKYKKLIRHYQNYLNSVVNGFNKLVATNVSLYRVLLLYLKLFLKKHCPALLMLKGALKNKNTRLQPLSYTKKIVNPKISIVIPVYNTQKYLAECINSIQRQTLKDIEIIFVNDASTDKSAEILQKYAQADTRITVLKNKTNIGPGLSRNRGLESARGEYVFFFDSDDWMMEKACEILYQKAKKNNLDLVVSNFTHYSDKDRLFCEKSLFPDSFSTFNEIINCGNCKSLFEFSGETINKLYRRKFLSDKNIMFTDLPCGEDHLFWLESLTKDAQLMVLEQTLSVYRINRTGSILYNLSYNSLKQYKDNTLFNDKVMRLVELYDCNYLKRVWVHRYVKVFIDYRNKNMFWYPELYKYAKKYFSTVDLDLLDDEPGLVKFISVFTHSNYFFYNLKASFKNFCPTFFNIMLSMKSKIKR